MSTTRFATLAGRVALAGIAAGAFVWALDPHYRDLVVGISCLLLAAALIAMPRLGPKHPTVSTASARTVHVACASALGTIVSIRGWIAGGTPAFAHDWKWPLISSQLDGWTSILRASWLSWGSGAPAIQELASYPIVLTAHTLGTFLSPAATLYCVLVAMVIVGGIGAARVAAASGLGPAWQLLFAFAYPLLPPAFDRLCAGHVNWLLGYALFPHFITALFTREPSPARAAILGLTWGLAASQVEFLVFFGIALAAGGKRALHWDVLGAAALACGIQAPMIATLIASHPTAAFDSAHANLAWQSAQSSGVLMGMAGGADPVHYFEVGEPLAAFMLAPLVLTAAYGALTAFQFRGLAVLWLVASAWAAGLRGPFAAIAGPLFQNFAASAVLREFSHAEVVVALPLLLFAALGVRLLAAGRGVIAVAVFAVLLAPAVAPMLDGTLSSVDAPVRVPRSYDAVAAFVASLPGDGQILWLPEIQPLAFDHTRGGADSLGFPTGLHTPYLEYRPTVEIVTALRALSTGKRDACGLLGDLDVQAVVVRPSVKSIVTWPDFQQTPGESTLLADGLLPAFREGELSVYTVPCYRGVVTWARASTLRGDWLDLVGLSKIGATDEVTLPPAPPQGVVAGRDPRVQYSTVDPRDGWVPLSARDDYLPAFGYAFGEVVLTRDASAGDLARYVLAAIPGSHYKWEPADWVERQIRVGPVAVWLVDNAANQSVVPGIPGSSSAFEPQGGKGEYFGPAPPQGSIVVLHQRNFGAWRADVDGVTLKPYPADGFAVGWIIDSKAHTLAIHYAAPPMWLLWCIAGVSLFFALTLAVGRQLLRLPEAAAALASKYGRAMLDIRQR